jgi:integrase
VRALVGIGRSRRGRDHRERQPGRRGRARDKAGGKTTNADQTIAIDKATVAALAGPAHDPGPRARVLRTDYHPGGYVLTFEDARPPHPDSIRQRFDRLAAAAGLPRFSFHHLRHSYATGALKAGISPRVVSDRIRHANVGFFLQTYAHVLAEDERDAAEQAATFLIRTECEPNPAANDD